MTRVTTEGGLVVMHGGLVGTGQACCCGVYCCCNDIDLNVLLYGNAEYSWPTIRPGTNRQPTNGTEGARPTDPALCTDPNHENDDCCNEIEPGVFEWTCSGRWEIMPACLRWLCRCVDSEGDVVCSQTYGGPTTNNRDLTELFLDAFGAETEPGCYVYTVEFFAWRRKRTPENKTRWIPRDDLFTPYKTKVTSCP